MLTTLGYPGLQIEVSDGVYKTVKTHDNHIIINIGQIFSHITNYQLKATWHRVLDIGIDRYSCPFFLVPKYEAVIPSNFLQPDQEQMAETMIFGHWIVKTFKIRSLPDHSGRYRDAETGAILNSNAT